MRRNALGLSRVYVLVLGLIALAFFLLCSELHGVQAPQGSLSAPFQLDPSGPGAWEPGRSRGGVLCGPGSASHGGCSSPPTDAPPGVPPSAG